MRSRSAVESEADRGLASRTDSLGSAYVCASACALGLGAAVVVIGAAAGEAGRIAHPRGNNPPDQPDGGAQVRAEQARGVCSLVRAVRRCWLRERTGWRWRSWFVDTTVHTPVHSADRAGVSLGTALDSESDSASCAGEK